MTDTIKKENIKDANAKQGKGKFRILLVASICLAFVGGVAVGKYVKIPPGNLSGSYLSTVDGFLILTPGRGKKIKMNGRPYEASPIKTFKVPATFSRNDFGFYDIISLKNIDSNDFEEGEMKGNMMLMYNSPLQCQIDGEGSSSCTPAPGSSSLKIYLSVKPSPKDASRYKIVGLRKN